MPQFADPIQYSTTFSKPENSRKLSGALGMAIGPLRLARIGQAIPRTRDNIDRFYRRYNYGNYG